MESRVFLSSLDHFMLSPLVSWVKTFVPCDGGIHLDFSELLDGVFLNDIMIKHILQCWGQLHFLITFSSSIIHV
uniref:Uncharacterized protein n=1 Tax=Gouania willdenowi TaxID=441366 RepID=A0A8C5HH49_GOUWI